MPPAPPAWLVTSANVATLLSCVLLVMYLLNKLECNKFVRLTLALQVVVVTLALLAYLGTTPR